MMTRRSLQALILALIFVFTFGWVAGLIKFGQLWTEFSRLCPIYFPEVPPKPYPLSFVYLVICFGSMILDVMFISKYLEGDF